MKSHFFALFSILVIANISKANSSDFIETIACIQRIVDHKYAGNEGVSISVKFLSDLISEKENILTIKNKCESFIGEHDKQHITREEQLIELDKYQHIENKNIYFYLRGIIRPLIKCIKSEDFISLLWLCKSTTGKSWYEISIKNQNKNLQKTFRLGHSQITTGLLSFRPQDYFNNEDHTNSFQDYRFPMLKMLKNCCPKN